MTFILINYYTTNTFQTKHFTKIRFKW